MIRIMSECAQCGEEFQINEEAGRVDYTCPQCGFDNYIGGPETMKFSEQVELFVDTLEADDVDGVSFDVIRKRWLPIIHQLETSAEKLSAEATLETLADIEHERWSGWMKYQFANWTDENIERWKMQMVTPYSDLPEHSKESDRTEARKTLKAIADILEG